MQEAHGIAESIGMQGWKAGFEMPIDAAEQEMRRVAAVRATGLLDTEREVEFDQLIQLAAAICGTPMSFFTLIDAARQWIKASIGSPVRETPREYSICSHAITQSDLFVVEDARQDVRFREIPAVAVDGGIRFYAGMPVAGPDGYLLGTLCVADVIPRYLSDAQRTALEVLATQLRARLELRSEQRRLQEALKAKEQLVAALQSSEDRFRTFMDHGPFLSYIKDEEGRFMFYNQRVADTFRTDRKKWLGRTITELWPGQLAESYRRNDLEAMAMDGELVREEETRDESGVTTFWRTCKFRFLNEHGRPLLGGISLDITDEVLQRRALESSNAELQEFATTDALTGVLNRRMLDNHLRRVFVSSLRHNSSCSVVLLDIDHFKQVNDQFGHDTGDEVLRRLGRLLRQLIRAGDEAGRYGGEEMMLILPNTDASGAMLLAERVRAAMREADWPRGPVTASFGVAAIEGTSDSAERLVSRADDAMYEAKRSGRDRVVGRTQMVLTPGRALSEEGCM